MVSHYFQNCLGSNKINLYLSDKSAEIKELADYGITMPPNMQGLTEEQIIELKLKDEWEDKCVPSQGSVFRKDEIGRRNGRGTTVSLRATFRSLINGKMVFANLTIQFFTSS